jgi:hypothetical protein
VRERESSVGKKQRMRVRRKGPRQPKQYSKKGASLDGTLLWYKGTNNVGALLSMWHDTSGPGGGLGHYSPWRRFAPLVHK